VSARALDAAIIASATLAIVGAPFALGQPALVFVFKPLTTILILLRAWPRGRDVPRVRTLVLAGLVLSLVGDIALMWPAQGFLPGLVAFLLAHLCYIAAFTRGVRFAARPLALVFYAAVAAAVLAQLWPHVPAALRGPVLAYVVALAAMASQAAVVWLAARDSAAAARARVLAIGGALFLCSDALLAINKFASPLPAANLWILATYWSAQWCIAWWLPPRSAATS
jgi:uncharacterized membrane protein YhhN